MKHTIFFLSIVLSVMGTTHAGDTLKLFGESPDAKLLIIHADDIGMSHNVNMAGIDALKKGIVTSASVMMPCPWVPELAKLAKADPDLDLGLHLTMNCEWGGYRWPPVAPSHLVPGLIDPLGYMHSQVRTTIQTAKPEEVETEIRAQVQRALAMGLQPTHMDSHMGTLYYHPGFLQAAIRVSEEFNIPFMLMDINDRITSRWGTRDFMDAETVATWKKRGIPLLDDLLSIENVKAEESRAWYEKTIDNLKPGLSLLIVHPGLPSEELSAITSAHKQREMDYQIFTDLAMRERIEKNGIKLIGWREVKAVWDKRER